ncbi:hypothetical protein FOXYS1_15814 [Fusarium oxysporum]|uniref:Bacterial alpha-L-rhamnosidase N-terminal domain-containing protein n=1 Tax=Fusarium oxysporum TaxID=5507 RepID=A0A8H4YPT7_FUSOX|nr:hypothetical protein FOXYS1_15814 [Fusarium oxysporum]
MEDWIASFITSRAKFQGPNSPLRPVRFRKSFSLPPKRDILRARLYVTAYGVYEAYINGTRVGNHALAPGWQSYRHRLHHQTFDVSSLLNENNTVGIEAGEGWYVTRLGFFGGSRYIYGDEIAVLAQLEISLLSGESIFVKTDETWTCNPSPILTSEIYDGEVCDLRLDNENWTSFKLDEASTTPVRALPPPKATLVAPDAPPVRVTQEVEALNVFRTKSGKTIVDFGQNLAGVVRIRSLLLPAGKQVTLTHAEVMENGELGIRPLRHARARDIIISSGKEILS